MPIRMFALDRLKEEERVSFETLFSQHADRMRKLPYVDVNEVSPTLHKRIQETVREMDAAWLRGDIQRFTQAMTTIEDDYRKVLSLEEGQ